MNNILQVFVLAGMILAIITIPVLLLIIPYKIVERIIPPIIIRKLIEDEIKIITEPLIKYYKIPQKFIVTKCYTSTDKAVINKDVIIYIYQGKIRLYIKYSLLFNVLTKQILNIFIAFKLNIYDN